MRKDGEVKIIMWCCNRMNVNKNLINEKKYKEKMKNKKLLKRIEKEGF